MCEMWGRGAYSDDSFDCGEFPGVCEFGGGGHDELEEGSVRELEGGEGGLVRGLSGGEVIG